MTSLLLCLTLFQAKGAGLAPPEKPLYRFVAYGDTRGRSATDYDMTVQKEIIARAAALKPNLILQTGDLVFDSSVPELWTQFDEAMQPIWAAKIPYYPARGNHDNLGVSNYEPFLQEKIVPKWQGVRPGGNLLNYAVDKAPLRFIAIDTESATNSASTQYAWLESELSDAVAKGLAPIVFFHVAIHTNGNHGPDLSKRADLEPLFQKYGVILAFQGHDHIYYRTRRFGIVYVVTGGGGAPLYNLHAGRDPRDPGSVDWPDVSAKAYHYCVCEVYADRIDFTAVALRNVPGAAPIDRFSIPLALKSGDRSRKRGKLHAWKSRSRR
jgi:hypothetical protein